MAEGSASNFEMDDDVVESLLRTLEEMTDNAINKGSPASDDSETSDMSKWLESPLGHFFDACASMPHAWSAPHSSLVQEPHNLASCYRDAGNGGFVVRSSGVRLQTEPAAPTYPAERTVTAVTPDFQGIGGLCADRSDSATGPLRCVSAPQCEDNDTMPSSCRIMPLPHTYCGMPLCDSDDLLSGDAQGIMPQCNTQSCVLFSDTRNTLSSCDSHCIMPSCHNAGIMPHCNTQDALSPCDNRNPESPSDTHGTMPVCDDSLTMTLSCREMGPFGEITETGSANHLVSFLNSVPADGHSDFMVVNASTAAGNACFPEGSFPARTPPSLTNNPSPGASARDDLENSRESTSSTLSSWGDLLSSIDLEEQCLPSTDSNRYGGVAVLQALAQAELVEVPAESAPSSPAHSPQSHANQKAKPLQSAERSAPFDKFELKEKRTTAPVGHAQKLLPPCRVCSQPGTGLHYGVNTCEACKGFFRRSLVRKRPYVCKGKGTCDLNGNQKRICAACRYKRCLAVGMSPEAIKQGRYTYQKRTQDYHELRRLEAASGLDGPDLSDVDVDVIVEGLLDASRHVLTNADVPADVMQSKSRQVSESCELRKTTFGLHALSPEEHEEIYRTTGIDIDGRKTLIEFVASCLERYIRGYVRFAKGIPRFKDLPLNDQANLLKAGRKEFWYLGAYRGYSRKYNTFYAPNGVVYTKTEQALLLGNEYCDYEFKIADQFQKWDVTRNELAVLKAICLTFTDRCDLEDSKMVENIQTLLLKCFYMLLSRRHDNPNMAFAQALDKLVALRDLSEFDIKNRSRMFVRSAYMEHPVLREVALF